MGISVISRCLAPAGFRALSERFGHLFGGVCPVGLIELLGAGGAAGPIAAGNLHATSWEFQLFHGVYHPLRFGNYRRGVGIYLGGVCSSGLIELLDAGGKAGPTDDGNWNPTGWEFQLFHGVYRPMVSGRYRRGLGIYLAGLRQRVY